MQPGMILKKSLYNRFGQMILAEGTKLEEKHKRILKTWGVSSLAIVDTNDSETGAEEEFDERIKEKAIELLKKRMFWSPRNSIEESMYQVALKRTMEKIIRHGNDII